MVDTSSPCPSAAHTNNNVAKNNNRRLPFTVTSNMIYAATNTRAAATSEISAYGIILPSIRLSGLTGETSICSIVFRSFSLTIESAVAITPVIAKMKAISPGTRNFALFISGLYQIRAS